MRGIFIGLIMLIGMISLTGFGSTADLPSNPLVVSSDVDVGIVTATVEHQSFDYLFTNGILFRPAQKVEVPYFDLTFTDKQFYFESLYNYNLLIDIEQPPNNQTICYRCPRDGLNDKLDGSRTK